MKIKYVVEYKPAFGEVKKEVFNVEAVAMDFIKELEKQYPFIQYVSWHLER